MSPSFLFPAFPGLTEVLLSAPPSERNPGLPPQNNKSPYPRGSRGILPPGPPSRSRQVLQVARPGPQIAPRPSLARPAPSLASPPPGAWAQAQGPRDLRSRGPTARCCASHPGRGFGPGPLTHPTIARPKSWCFLRAAAPTSPSTHRRKGPATRSPERPLGPLSSRKASSKEEPIRQNGRRPGTFPACRAPAETRLGPGGEGGATPPARGRDLRARPRASGGQALTPPHRVCARRALASLTACAVGPFHFEKKQASSGGFDSAPEWRGCPFVHVVPRVPSSSEGTEMSELRSCSSSIFLVAIVSASFTWPCFFVIEAGDLTVDFTLKRSTAVLNPRLLYLVLFGFL